MPEEIMTVLQHLVDEGEFIKGFLLEDLNEVCWGRKDMLESASGIEKMRDFVLPPSDPLAPYFAKLLRERFGFGSAYLVHIAHAIGHDKIGDGTMVFDMLPDGAIRYDENAKRNARYDTIRYLMPRRRGDRIRYDRRGSAGRRYDTKHRR